MAAGTVIDEPVARTPLLAGFGHIPDLVAALHATVRGVLDSGADVPCLVSPRGVELEDELPSRDERYSHCSRFGT